MSLPKQPLELNSSFRYALNLLEKTHRSAFVTGRAGTGKSTLLNLFRTTTKKKVVVLAPTGIAALNVKGQTIHSFFGFPARPLQARDIRKKRNRKLYERLETLVIDEVSMVRADLMDNIDRFLRINRNNPEPFGGVQLILFGDLFQLPPVVASEAEQFLFQNYYESPYFFSAHVIRDGFPLEMIELPKVYRQESRHFLRLLDAIRTNRMDYDDLTDLNERYRPDFQREENYITLSPRNALVDKINELELLKLKTPEFEYQADITGDFDPRLFPAEFRLRLREGAQVMFVKNDPEKDFVNGTIGKLIHLSEEKITVLVRESGKDQEIVVPKLEWEILQYVPAEEGSNSIDTRVIGTFKQYPLKLAWALTIHKSQGKTFDRVIIDMGYGAFAHGQTYVALSRCRTLSGIVLKKPLNMKDVLVDEKIISYYEQNF